MLSSIPLVGRLFSRGPAPPAARVLAAVPVHHIESDPEKRARTLKYLLKGSHINNSLVQDTPDGGRKYNDVAYLLYAVYMMGGSADLLNSVYGAGLSSLSEWDASPAELARIDWRDFLGQPAYQHAYVDFFEDVLAEHSTAYNWHAVVQQYLLGEGYDESRDMDDVDDGGDVGGDDNDASAKRGLFLRNCLLGASGAPILHLACAHELDSRQLAMEGLALAASTYREDVARFLAELEGATDAEAQRGPQDEPLRAILEAARADSRLRVYKNRAQPASGGGQQPGFDAMGGAMQTPDARTAFIDYWRRWDLEGTADLTPKLREAQRVFTDVLVASAVPGEKKHDRSLSTAVAVSHGVRVLLPFIPAKYHLGIMQQWWLLALSVYVEASMPAVPEDAAAATPQKDWRYIDDKMPTAWRSDQSYMMALYSFRAAQQTWPDEADHYLAAAVRFVDDFDGWS